MAVEDVESSLWDNNTFKLHHHWPRRSLLDSTTFYFTRQPQRLFYEIYFYTTFPLRLLLKLLPLALYQTYFDPNSPKGRSLLSTLSILIGRSLIDDLWIPTGGGARGLHYDKNLDDKERMRLLKKTKALPFVLQTSKILKLDQIRQPVAGWAKEAGINTAESLTTWWFGKRSEELSQNKAGKDEQIMMYLSGGGYFVGTCYPTDDLGSIAPTLLKQIQKTSRQDQSLVDMLPQSIVSLEYRRTGQSSTPSTLLDALTLFYHLVNDLHFESRNISMIGDSAGGHLINCLVRYLVEGGEEPPGKIVLISVSVLELSFAIHHITESGLLPPWGDQAGTIIEHPQSSFQRYLPYDILSDHFYHYCRDMYASKFTNPSDTLLLDVYFSPAAIPSMVKTRKWHLFGKDEDGRQKSILVTKASEKDIFKGWPRTLLICGNYEVLRDQSTEMLKRLEMAKREEEKNEPDQLDFFTMETNHDPFVMPFSVFARQRREAMQRIVTWLAL